MLYQHQKDIIADDRKKTGIWLGTGSGKTLTALCLARGKTLVICPKTQWLDENWEREAKKNNLKIDLTVISKEQFRTNASKLKRFDTVIVDEAHTVLGVTPNIKWRNKKPIPKASQLFEALDEYLIRNKPERFYLCTATIAKSPMTVWAAGKLLNFEWNFYAWRDTFYVRLPMPGREVFTVKNDNLTKEKLAIAVRKLGYVGRLEDYFDVPEQTFKTIYVDLNDEQKKKIREIALEYPDPIVLIGKKNQIENGILVGDEFRETEYFDNAKIDKLVDLAEEFPKMIIICKYTAQIEMIKQAFKNKKVLILQGATKDRKAVIEEANKAIECIFICQAQISAGWELPDYPVMVFASRTYSFTDYFQSLGRIQRANNIKKNLYINLLVRGGIDEAVDKCLKNKTDFNEKIYILA